MADSGLLSQSVSIYNESYTGRRKSQRLHHSRSLRFHQSMSLFLQPENFEDSCVLRYASLPKVRWSVSIRRYEEDSVDALKVLTGTTWTIYKVSPLCRFSYSETHLKKYTEFLRKALERKSVFCDNNRKIEVAFKVIEELSPTENDEPGVQILVKNGSGKSFKVLYKGYLISWKNKKIITSTAEVRLPVLLCCFADRTVEKIVHSALQQLFDTSIQQVTFPQDDFMCFSVLVTGFLEEDNSSVITLVYHAPERPTHETLKFRIALAKVMELWNRVHDEDATSVPVRKLLDYQLSLENQMENTYRIYLDHAQFSGMFVPKQVELHVNGKIKFSSPKVFNILLKYLTNKT